MSEIESSELEFLSCKIWVFEIITVWVFEFCCYLKLILLLLAFGHKNSFEFCYNLGFFLLQILSSFEFCPNWVLKLSQFKFLNSLTNWVIFCHTLSFVGENSFSLKKVGCFKKYLKHFLMKKSIFFLVKKNLLKSFWRNNLLVKKVFGEKSQCGKKVFWLNKFFLCTKFLAKKVFFCEKVYSFFFSKNWFDEKQMVKSFIETFFCENFFD